MTNFGCNIICGMNLGPKHGKFMKPTFFPSPKLLTNVTWVIK